MNGSWNEFGIDYNENNFYNKCYSGSDGIILFYGDIGIENACILC